MNNPNAFRIARFLYYAGCLTVCQLTIRPALSFTLSDWIFFFVLLAVITEIIIVNRRIEIRLPGLFLASCSLIVTGGLLSLLNMNNKMVGLQIIFRIIYITIIWFWLGTMVLRTEAHIQRATKFWLFSVALTGISAVLQLIDPYILPGSAPIHGRMVGFTGHPNDLGALSAIGWGAAIVLFNNSKFKSTFKFTRYPLLIALLAGLMLSGSTGSAMGAIAATAYWLFMTKSKKQWTRLTVIIFIFIVPLLAIQHIGGGKSVLHRFNKADNPNTPLFTLSTRIDDYTIAMENAKKNPLLGVGFQPGGAKTRTGNAIHNVFIAVLYEAGLIGLIGLIILILSTIISARYLIIKANQFYTDKYFVMALSASLIAFFVYALGAPVLYQRYGWISLSLLFSLRAVIQREKKYEKSVSV